MLNQSRSTPSRDLSSFTPANPFYDNIRQNVELANGVGDKIPLHLSPHVSSRRHNLPSQWLRDLLLLADSPDHGAETLALQFYRIELGEQRRLQGIMSHHSRQVQSHNTIPIEPRPPEPSTCFAHFPFSITAGIEMGTKNRYRNIWPFEHARVRLRTTSPGDGSDYFNASYVQPIITKRRYIATQGPLPTTFNDFWTIVWEQSVPVIVMLTREVEGNHVKSDCYWKDGQYGHLQLTLDEQIGVPDAPSSLPFNHPAFNFSTPTVMDPASDAIIKRVFTLRNLHQPHTSPRKIIHLQYLGWPDLNVPESSRGVLDLIKHMNRALVNREEDEQQPGPIMLHCSAGVGRTGGFIIIDSVLDGIRQEIRKAMQESSSSGSNDSGTTSDAMDLDEAEPEVPMTQRAGTLLDPMAMRSTAPFAFASTTSLYSGASDSIRTSFKPSPTSGPGSSNKQQKVSHALAEKLVNSTAPASPPLSSAATISAWSANLPSSTTEYASNGNGNGHWNGDGNAKACESRESKPTSTFPSPPDFRGDENDIYFKVPRSLHQPDSPLLLSTLCEPIREVLEDMREQRMSLCQSLRQYVFAHRVILEGALEVVDEEKEAFLRHQELERMDEGKRRFQPWGATRANRYHRHRESATSSLSQSVSHLLKPWSSASSLSLPSDTASSAAPSSATRRSETNHTPPLSSSTVLARFSQTRHDTAPATSSPVPTSPMTHLTISSPSPSPSPGSRHMAGRYSLDRPRTPGSVAIGVPPPTLTGKRSHSPFEWERKVDRERSVEGHEQEKDGTPSADGQHLAKRSSISIKGKQRSSDSLGTSTSSPRSRFGAGQE